MSDHFMTLPSKWLMYTPGSIANSQRTPTKINKHGPIAKVRTLVEQVILKKGFKDI